MHAHHDHQVLQAEHDHRSRQLRNLWPRQRPRPPNLWRARVAQCLRRGADLLEPRSDGFIEAA